MHTDVWILIFGQSDGIICKQGVRHELCGVALTYKQCRWELFPPNRTDNNLLVQQRFQANLCNTKIYAVLILRGVFFSEIY